MYSLSLSKVLALTLLQNVVSVLSQAPLASVTEPPTLVQSAQPELQGGSGSASGGGGSGGSCGGCYLVADVAGLVWYSEVFLNAATAVVAVGMGNGSSAQPTTRTSVIQDEGQFTFTPGAGGNNLAALTQVNFEPTVEINGAQLTSPTAYNVFTAYSVTSAFVSDGICVTTSGSRIQLTSAYSEAVPQASGKVILDAAGQQSFINFLGFSSCSAGGENIVPTALVQVSNTTTTSSTTFSGPIPQIASVKLSINQSTPASVSATPTTFPSVNAPAIVLGNKTITPTANPIGLPVVNGTTVNVPTTPGNLSTNTPVPFFSGASHQSPAINAGVVSWLVGSMALGMAVYYL